MSNDLRVLQILPVELSVRLETHYKELKTNFANRRFKPAEFDAAQFCEVVFRILEWETSGESSYTPIEKDIKNFGQSVSRFESNSSCDE